MTLNTVTIEQLNRWNVEIYKTYNPVTKRFKDDLRYGQAFMNEFLHGITHPELFYNEDPQTCLVIILETYVQDNFKEERVCCHETD